MAKLRLEVDTVREAVKAALGMPCDSCKTCIHYFPAHGGGHEYPMEYDPPECAVTPTLANLLSFPFKRPMPCWEPDIWWSKFSEGLCGDYEIDKPFITEFRAALEHAKGGTNGQAAS